MKGKESLSYLVPQLRKSREGSVQFALLERCCIIQPAKASELQLYMDALLFILAFPFSEKIRLLALKEKHRLYQWLEKKQYSAKWQRQLEGSGLPYTVIRCQFSLDLAHWFLEKFPDQVGPDQSNADPVQAASLLQSLLPGIEFHDASQRQLSLWSRVKLLSGHQKDAAAMKWLTELVLQNRQQVQQADLFYDQLSIFLRWDIRQPVLSRPGLQWPVTSVHYREPLPAAVNSLSIVNSSIGKPITLSLKQKQEIIGMARISLACYYRETDPVTYADPEETFLFDMGEGLQIALMGMQKNRQLALESYIGFMAFMNGIPVSYGGGWIFGGRCKIGVNIYPPFRGAGSDRLFCQVLRLYFQRFGVQRFVVKPYQFGKGNPEGLASGAFWFYYKLGFRPSRKDIRENADAEWEKIRANPSYRTPIAVLRSFTACNKEWDPVPAKNQLPEAERISMAVTHMIRERFGGDRALALATCRKELLAFLGPGNRKLLQTSDQRASGNWSLIMSLVNKTEIWTVSDRHRLARIILNRSNGPEIDYILGLRQHRIFWKEINAFLDQS